MRYLSNAIMRGAVWARFGDLIVEAAPHRRAAGLVAAGIDRLALPMEQNNRTVEVSPAAPIQNRDLRGWLSYNE
jgi:hypothetical protein